MFLPSWLRSLRSGSSPGPIERSRRASRRRPMSRRLLLELLEDRTLPSTLTVLNTGDNGGVNPAAGAGTGTLRQAIVDANAAAGADTIAFNIPGAGAHTIAPLSALP